MKRTNTYLSRIISTEYLTPDVIQLRIEKPDDFNFIPGQAVDIAINKPRWKEKARPFTITSIPQHNYLEFIIKSYTAKNGMTKAVSDLVIGDELIIGQPWGALQFKTPGLFIAAGTGITPFISMFRMLSLRGQLFGNRLLVANRRLCDIIHKEELANYFPDDFHSILSEEKLSGHRSGFISKELVSELLPPVNSSIYLCGPLVMMQATLEYLSDLGVPKDCIVTES